MKRGVTLMEVLIAIFVLSIGLLGLFSLLPVARFFMADGSKYDHTSVMGQKGLKELEIRTELMDPSNWFAPAGGGKFQEVCPASQVIGGATYASAYNYNWANNSTVSVVPAAPFVLDPLACAYPDNLAMNANSSPNVPTFFPPGPYSLDGVGNPGSPALARVTVPKSFGGAVVGGASFASPMAFGQAAKNFQSTDDLLFELPSDGSARPTVALSAPPAAQYSVSNGDYSWFAVIDNTQKPWNPGPNQVWGAVGDDNDDGIPEDESEAGWPGSDDVALWKTSGGELWNVWVVVVHKRNLGLFPAAGEVPPERMCYCDFLTAPFGAVQPNAGLGGGDCVLSVSIAQAPSGEWLNVKVNQWIMLSAWPQMVNKSGTYRGQLPTIRWFRISAVGDIVQTPGGWQRNVTLQGPDWNPYSFVDAINPPPVVGMQYPNYQTAYATIVDGVTGVFEATIEQGE